MRTILILAAAALAAPASAKVVSSDPHHLVVEQELRVAAPPGAVWSALGRIGEWWSKDHTYSGKAQNLSLGLRAGGCFCELIPPGGAIEHMRVVLVRPNEQLVMTGALGPLLTEGVSGVMDVGIAPDGGGAKLTMRYKASGFASGGAEKMAPLVDMVLGQQAQSLARLAAGPR